MAPPRLIGRKSVRFVVRVSQVDIEYIAQRAVESYDGNASEYVRSLVQKERALRLREDLARLEAEE